MQADYVIVGAGPAGCVLANRLTEDPATRVILIEAGGRDWNPLIHIPVGYTRTHGRNARRWAADLIGLNHRASTCVRLNDRALNLK
jgi:choline dehydrogenase